MVRPTANLLSSLVKLLQIHRRLFSSFAGLAGVRLRPLNLRQVMVINTHLILMKALRASWTVVVSEAGEMAGSLQNFLGRRHNVRSAFVAPVYNNGNNAYKTKIWEAHHHGNITANRINYDA